MTAVILKTLITFLALYGLHELFFLFAERIFKRADKSCESRMVAVIKVRNSQDSLESVVRLLILKLLKESHSGVVPEILIVDYGSDDETMDIAEKLCSDYPFVHCITSDMYDRAKNACGKRG